MSKQSTSILSIILLLGTLLVIAACSDDPVSTNDDDIVTADVVGQGPEGTVVAEDVAELRRSADGIEISVSIPTPTPGEYDYPSDAEVGPPEVFTLWVFVFEEPGSEEFDGAFWGSGEVVNGSPELSLSARVTEESDPFAGVHLENPETAEVRLAIAPHGKLDRDKLPDQVRTPSGGAEHWWHVEFEE